MNLGNYTIKAAEIVQQAQQLAFNAQSPSIEPSHILKALIEAAETPIEYLLKKNNVTRTIVANKLEELLATLPRVKGEAAQQISREANTLLLRAEACLQTFNDQFVTPEHLLLALVQGEDAVGKLLKNAGLTESGLVTAIKELRKGESVTSSTQSQQFNALSKYAKNLNDLARQGKLDPVIGRDENGKTIQLINLYPINSKSKNYHTVKLFIDKGSKQIASIKVLGKDGNNYTYLVKSFLSNTEMNDALFVFDKQKHPKVEINDLR